MAGLMAEAAAAREPIRGRATCLYCGVELGADPSSVKGLCTPCSTRMLGSKNGNGGPAATKPAPPQRQPTLHAAHSSAALAELIAQGPSSETPRMVSELLAADKRMTTLSAFVPIVGTSLIRRSEVHTESEKRWLSWASILISAAIFAFVLTRIPTADVLDSQLHDKIVSEFAVLGGIAEQHRVERGAYPDETEWRAFVARADHRFYDPWARPYRYTVTPGSITVETLGRDGLSGGAGPDRDLSARFRPGSATPVQD